MMLPGLLVRGGPMPRSKGQGVLPNWHAQNMSECSACCKSASCLGNVYFKYVCVYTHVRMSARMLCWDMYSYNRMGAKKVENIELGPEVRLDSKDNIQVDLGDGSF